MTDRARRIGLLGGGVILLVVSFTVLDVQLRYISRILPTDRVPTMPTAIVLGASVMDSGIPSDALRDRLLTALRLYRERRVTRIIVSGDDGRYRRNETATMRQYLLERGVATEDVLVDGQGYRTYESCKRAREVYGVQEAIVVTQRFHLARALYLCNRLGIRAYGVGADLNRYKKGTYFWIRDLVASIVAWSNIHLMSPSPPVTERGKTMYGVMNSL